MEKFFWVVGICLLLKWYGCSSSRFQRDQKVVNNQKIERTLASEIDSFTLRHTNIKDSLHRLNDYTRKNLIKAAEMANSHSGRCDSYELHYSVWKIFGGNPRSHFELQVQNDYLLDKRRVYYKDSIYSELRFYQSLMGVLRSAMGAILNVDGHIIGDDKFGHFFNIGYRYFRKAYVKNYGVEEALSYGAKIEKRHYGLWTTGVYSYADLVANYLGMKFYSELSDKYQKTRLRETYFKCEDGKWVKNTKRLFDWREYMTAALDEGINCTSYGTHKSFAQKIAEKIGLLEQKHKKPYQCPIDLKKCQQIAKEFAKYKKELISPLCLEKLKK